MKSPVWAFLILVLCPKAFALDCTGAVYELDAGRKNPLYTVIFHSDDETQPIAHTHSVHKTPKGEDSTIEDLTLDHGSLKEYTLNRKRQGELLKLTINGGQAVFTKTVGGKTETATEKKPQNLLVGLSIMPFIRMNWDALNSGKSIDFRLGSVDRMETVGFSLKKIENDKAPKDFVTIEMKASSFFIAAIVKPLHFVIDPKTKVLSYFTGRSIVRREENGKFSDLDAETVYQCQPQ